jgi:molybdate transport system substrate-binding protein
MMRTLAWLGLAVMLPSVLLSGCTAGADSSSPGGAAIRPTGPLRVAAASDLQGVLPQLVDAFRRQTRVVGLTIEPTYGASGTLARQIRQGAPFDLFLSADRQYPDELATAGAVEPATVRPYARGVLVLAVMAGGGLPSVTTLDDLAAPEFRRVAIANPTFAPYGRAAQQALDRSGLSARLKGRVVFGTNVREVVQFVRSGSAEAGFVPRALAEEPGLKASLLDLASQYDPIVQTLAVTTDSSQKALASLFADFLLGPEGQAILFQHGFLPP